MIAFLSTGLTAAAIIVMGSTTALAIPLLFLNYNLYRFVTSFIEACFLSWQSFLLRYSYGIRFVVTGAPLKRGTNVLMSNHPTRTDWMMSWPVFESRGFIQDLHFVAKTDVRAVPVIGWCMQQCRHVFLQRRWEADEAAMTSSLQLLAGVPGESYSLLLFPEGTDLSPKNVTKSQEFARKSGLPVYNHVLNPRSKGLWHTLAVLRQAKNPVSVLYDITIAYDGPAPVKESQLFSGVMPRAVHFHFVAYAVCDLPKDEATLATWLAARFEAKEAALRSFYASSDPNRSLASAYATTAGSAHDVSSSVSGTVSSPCDFAQTQPLQLIQPSYLIVFAFLALALTLSMLFPLAMAVYVAIYVIANVVIQRLGGFDAIEQRFQGRRQSIGRQD